VLFKKMTMMKIFQIFGFILLMLVLISIASCHKNEKTVIYFPDDLKPYALFKMGSYWIYKNDKTGVEDSTFLLSSPSLDFTSSSETSSNIRQNLNSYYGGKFLSSVYGQPYYSFAGSEYILHHSFHDNFGSVSILSGQIKKGYKVINDYDHSSFRVIGTDDTLIIDDTIYKNVLTTQWARFQWRSSDTMKLTYFFDKIYGLVRFVKSSGGTDTTWSLMRSHVLQ
jgi:hypothetical protein